MMNVSAKGLLTYAPRMHLMDHGEDQMELSLKSKMLISGSLTGRANTCFPVNRQRITLGHR